MIRDFFSSNFCIPPGTEKEASTGRHGRMLPDHLRGGRRQGARGVCPCSSSLLFPPNHGSCSLSFGRGYKRFAVRLFSLLANKSEASIEAIHEPGINMYDPQDTLFICFAVSRARF